MAKPGEYELPVPTSETYCKEVDGDFCQIDMDLFQEDTVAAVEKAHAERNCGNCVHSRIKVKKNLSACSRFLIPINYPLIFKCNDWKSKEADNADA